MRCPHRRREGSAFADQPSVAGLPCALVLSLRSRDYPDMLDWVVDFASHPTTEEVLVALETTLASYDTPGATRESVLADHGADRR